MISRDSENFVVRHYDWLVAGVGVLALLGGLAFFMCSVGEDPDEAAAEAVRAIDRRKPAENAVAKVDLTPYENDLRKARAPQLVPPVADPAAESFLASERRVKCKCGAVLVEDPERTVCPKCNTPLVVVTKEDEEAKKAEAWKKRFGVAADEADADGDGFSNREEFVAGSDPTDGKDHPDYLDSLKLELPLRETYVPFALTKAMQIPNGWRCEFLDPKQKDDYGRMGRSFSTTVGSEIVMPVAGRGTALAKNEPTGYVLKKFEKKEERRAITSGSSMKKSVDVSVATVVRKSDGKVVPLVMQTSRKNVRLAPIDVQAKLTYTRGTTKTFDVVVGSEIDLNGSKFRVKRVENVGKGAQVVLENEISGKLSTLKAAGE